MRLPAVRDVADASGATRMTSYRLESGGRIDGRAARFQLRRRRVRRVSRRHAGLGAARQRRTLSSAARSNITGRAAC